jgi:VanZ family protein
MSRTDVVDPVVPADGLRAASLWRALAVAVAAAILVLCWTPSDVAPDTPGPGWDKVGHALAFLAYGVAARRGRLGALAGLGGGLALAAVTEAGQAWFPIGRDGSWVDLAADAAGLLFGFSLGRTGRPPTYSPQDSRTS